MYPYTIQSSAKTTSHPMRNPRHRHVLHSGGMELRKSSSSSFVGPKSSNPVTYYMNLLSNGLIHIGNTSHFQTDSFGHCVEKRNKVSPFNFYDFHGPWLAPFWIPDRDVHACQMGIAMNQVRMSQNPGTHTVHGKEKN